MDAGFVTAKKPTTTTSTSFTLAVIFSSGSTARQPKLFVISRILTAEFLYSAEA